MCLKQVTLVRVRKYFMILHRGANKTKASLETFTVHKRKRNKKVITIKPGLFWNYVDRTWKYVPLWFTYFSICSLLRSLHCKLHGCIIVSFEMTRNSLQCTLHDTCFQSCNMCWVYFRKSNNKPLNTVSCILWHHFAFLTWQNQILLLEIKAHK